MNVSTTLPQDWLIGKWKEYIQVPNKVLFCNSHYLLEGIVLLFRNMLY